MENFTVDWVKSSTGKEFIREHHYTHGCHNGPMTVGLWRGGTLIGVCAFATPNSESVRACVWGNEFRHRVTELHRLVIVDETPKNTESWFISRCLRLLKIRRPDIWGVLSYADSTEGHVGTIYRASNAIYTGIVPGYGRFYRDSEGRLRAERQNGHHVTPQEAAKKGWTSERRGFKYRYLFLLPDSHTHRKTLMATLKLPVSSWSN